MPGHRMEWGSRAFAVAGSSCWNAWPAELRDLSVGTGTESFAKHLKIHLFRVGFLELVFQMVQALSSLSNIL